MVSTWTLPFTCNLPHPPVVWPVNPLLQCLTVPSLSSYFFVGMAPEVWLPPCSRPQNVSAAFCPSHAVRYRCHAAPLRPQHHRDSGQPHCRVSHAALKIPLKMLLCNLPVIEWIRLNRHIFQQLNVNVHRCHRVWVISLSACVLSQFACQFRLSNKWLFHLYHDGLNHQNISPQKQRRDPEVKCAVNWVIVIKGNSLCSIVIYWVWVI